MKLSLPIVLFSGLVLGSYSAVFFKQQTPVSGHEGQCHDGNRFYNKGEKMKWNDKICGQKICAGSTESGPLLITIHTCGKVGVAPGCYTVSKPELPYPKCCEQIVCPTSPRT